MKKLLLAGAALAALMGPVNADIATFGDYLLQYSDFAGTKEFGHVVVTGSGTNAHVEVDVFPNWLIQTGGKHQPLAFNLISGTITDLEDHNLFALGGANGASPFTPGQTKFSNTIVGTGGCSNGGSNNGCGVPSLTFDITGFGGFNSQPWDSNGNLPGGIIQIFFAADILAISPDCTGRNCTGNVGAGVPTTTFQVPGPIVGAGLPGLILAALGMFGLSCRRRRD